MIRKLLVLFASMGTALAGMGMVSPALAATHANPTAHRASKHKKKKPRSKSTRGPRGAQGPRGARGPVGATGSQGPQGAPGVNASSLAYGLVFGRGLAQPALGHSLESEYQHNVSVHPARNGGLPGTYCLALATGISSLGAILTVGEAELPPAATVSPATEVVLPYVTWISSAPNCAPTQLEVRTFTYTSAAGSLTEAPSDLVSFSFIVS
jgi:hypothetical protein